MDGGQLVQAHRVVDHDHLGGHVGQPLAGLAQRVERAVHLRVVVRVTGRDRIVRRFVGHSRYPSCDNFSVKWVATASAAGPHPATCECARVIRTALTGPPRVVGSSSPEGFSRQEAEERDAPIAQE